MLIETGGSGEVWVGVVWRDFLLLTRIRTKMDDCGLELVLKPMVGPQSTVTYASTCQFHLSEIIKIGRLQRRQILTIEKLFPVSYERDFLLLTSCCHPYV